MASSTLPEDKKAAARHGADILLWVMDYPNNFHKVVESIKEMDLPMDAIMEDMEKLVRDYELDGTHTE